LRLLRRSFRAARPRRLPGKEWHVAIVVENVPLGTDPRLRKQVDQLLAAGHRVSVVTMRDSSNRVYRDRRGMRLLEYPSRREADGPLGHVGEYASAFAWATLRLGTLRAHGRIDVLQVCQPPDIYFPLARLLRWTGTRVVVDQRDLMPELFRSRYPGGSSAVERVLHLFERRTQKVAHASITVNHYLAERLRAAGGGRSEVSVVWNGPVLARALEAVPDPRLTPAGTRLVVWVGKMGRQDRVDLLLDVAEDVVRRHGRTDVRFVLLGDGECLEELRHDAAARELDPWVTFSGWVTEPEVFAHLASADAGMDTSLQQEVSPVKAMEYMAQGLPFVCFDLRETRALCDGSAVLVPPGDVGAAADALLDLLDDVGRRTRLGENGRRRIRDELAWEHQAEVYLRVVGPGAPA